MKPVDDHLKKLILTVFRDPFHQLVEVLYHHLLLPIHHPGEAPLQRLARTVCISHAAPQLLCCPVTHQSVELWDLWQINTHRLILFYDHLKQSTCFLVWHKKSKTHFQEIPGSLPLVWSHRGLRSGWEQWPSPVCGWCLGSAPETECVVEWLIPDQNIIEKKHAFSYTYKGKKYVLEPKKLENIMSLVSLHAIQVDLSNAFSW